jgi:hypothetical protein
MLHWICGFFSEEGPKVHVQDSRRTRLTNSPNTSSHRYNGGFSLGHSASRELPDEDFFVTTVPKPPFASLRTLEVSDR